MSEKKQRAIDHLFSGFVGRNPGISVNIVSADEIIKDLRTPADADSEEEDEGDDEDNLDDFVSPPTPQPTP